MRRPALSSALDVNKRNIRLISLTPGDVVFYRLRADSPYLRRGYVEAVDCVEETVKIEGGYTLAAALVCIRRPRVELREGDTVYCAYKPGEWRVGLRNAVAPYWHLTNESASESGGEAYASGCLLVAEEDLLPILQQ